MNSVAPKSRLGRGLASLIGEPAPLGHHLPPEGEQRMVAISEIASSPLNPRKDFREDELAELAESIRTKGLVQPIIVRPAGMGGGYEIVAGERRWRAAQKAGVHTVPVIIRELNDREVLELAIIENVRAFFGPKVYETVIPRNTRIAEAPSHGKPILLYDYDCAGSQAYIRLATEIIERERRYKAA